MAIYISWLLALACLPTLYCFLGLIYDSLRGSYAGPVWFYPAGLFGWVALARALVMAPRISLNRYPTWVGLGLLCGVASVLWWNIDSGFLPPMSLQSIVVMLSLTGGAPILLVAVLLLISLSRNRPGTGNAT